MPSFLNQTIAGAIATGTHGSSIEHGSLSNQVLAVRAVLANGTLVEISEESHPFLLKAFRVNVGRLGVVTHVKMRITPETLAQRILTPAVPDAVLIEMMKGAQEVYKETGSLPEWMEETQFFWLATNGTVSFLHHPHRRLHFCSSRRCTPSKFQTITLSQNVKAPTATNWTKSLPFFWQTFWRKSTRQ